MKNRKIAKRILAVSESKLGRIIVLTGARQTGKTTLARYLFKNFDYISIEDPVSRSQYTQLTALQWKSLFPFAILDEVQKEPLLIESIKSVYDQWPEPRYILLGSSQLLLLEKVRESLAGRVVLFEFYPLTIPEIRTHSWDDEVDFSAFQEELLSGVTQDYLPSFILDKKMVFKQQAWESYLSFGGYPALYDGSLTKDEKYLWLNNYVRTYLERDIRDLAVFRDLDPFVRLQRYLAQNTGTLLNMNAIASHISISVKTVQRYIHYFEVSYQCITLNAWSNNKNKRLSKMPKFHFMDHGIVQAVLQRQGGVNGHEFESLVIAEIYKQIVNAGIEVQLYHLRTYDGKEVDLLIETPGYYLAIEIKMTENVNQADARNFNSLQEILDKPLKRCYILSNDRNTKYFGENVVAMHVAMFLG